VALIAVVVVIALTTIVTMEFGYRTGIDYASAVNARDEMRAHFLARSVMNLSRLVIKVQKDLLDRNRKALSNMGLPDMQIGDFMSLLETPICGSQEEVAGMASAFGTIDASKIKGMGISYGQCQVETFDSEDGKINLNCANGSATTQTALGNALTALVAPGIYDRIFEEEDGDGQLTDRAQFVRALIDYVDRDEAAFGVQGQTENYGYENLRDDYQEKNNYIDSIDELKLARGMDDRRWELFGPELTIYGGCKVNVAATQSPIQIVGILTHAAKNANDPVIMNPAKLWALAGKIAQARSMGFPFEDLNQFIEFAKDPDAAMGTKLEGLGGTPAPTTPGVPPVEGLQLDPTKLAQVARTGPRRTYRVVASAKVGRVEKRIIGIFDTDVQNQNMRDQTMAQKGAWVYWREE
jgi:general secretion pathway protein K